MECLKKCLVEFIGTFFLVFTVGSMVLLAGSGVVPALAIGFALMIMVYAGGHISGGHYNPAVSLAAAIRGALSWKNILQYWIAQCFGALAAALLVNYLLVNEVVAECPYSLTHLVIGEFLFTFALCYVVLQTATAKGTNGNSFYGLAIGSTVMVGAFAVGGILCFGAFNPAVAIGLLTMSVATLPCIIATVATNIVAAIVAALIFKFVTPEE